MTPLLAIDTSAAHCAAALLLEDRVAVRVEPMAKGQAERLMPLLEELLAAEGFGWRDLAAIGVGTGPGNFTGLRIGVPVINLTKTRLNDPYLWFLGTNDNPGDFRSSGCSACHVVYANDRDPRHSGPYAKFGHTGKSQTVDPTIPKDEPGHPLKHTFSNAIPTSQCMICHMHQPNIFVNSFLGYTMWDYESDAPSMWPKEQRYPTAAEQHKTLMRNPEEAATRGKWSDPEFSKDVSKLNPKLKNTRKTICATASNISAPSRMTSVAFSNAVPQRSRRDTRLSGVDKTRAC